MRKAEKPKRPSRRAPARGAARPARAEPTSAAHLKTQLDAAQQQIREATEREAVIAIENVRLFNETQEALERQTAISEILRVISGSPTNIRPVLDAIVLSALRFCAAEDAAIMLPNGNYLKLAAHRGTVPVADDLRYPNDGTSVSSRAFLQSRTIAVEDLQTAVEFPLGADNARSGGYHAIVAAPLHRDGTAIGAIVLRRSDAKPFSDREIGALETFADQAVIAIENVRLFNETKEALDRQTAISDILRVISSSPTDVQPVIDTIAESAARFCNADDAAIAIMHDDGTVMLTGTQDGVAQAPLPFALSHRSVTPNAITEARVFNVPDMEALPDDQFDEGKAYAREHGYRGFLAAPLLKDGRAIGALQLRRTMPGEFGPREVDLVQTFAAQAVIAIENVRLVSEIQEQSRQLEAASRHKSEFLANMSHELRTPLNAVIGFSDVLEQRMFGELNDRQADYVRDIAGSGRHLLDLVNEILDLSKIEAGRMELEPSEFALAETIRGAVGFIRERAARHGITLTPDVPNDLGTLVADERKVRQVLLNLLSNAVKFTPDGGQISVRAHRADGEIQVSVHDTGIGIAPEDQPRVFEEFQQVGKPSDRSREGTGLGLTLAKRFIELHGGRIWLESEVGKGTTFTFALPVGRTAVRPA